MVKAQLRPASTLLKTCRASTKSHSDKQSLFCPFKRQYRLYTWASSGMAAHAHALAGPCPPRVESPGEGGGVQGSQNTVLVK